MIFFFENCEAGNYLSQNHIGVEWQKIPFHCQSLRLVLSFSNWFIIICQMSFRNLHSKLFYLWKSSILGIVNLCDSDHNTLLWKSTDYEVFSKFKWQVFQRDDLTTVIFTKRYFLLFCSTFLALIWFDHWKVLLSYLHVNDICEKIRCGQDSAAIHNQKIYFLYSMK